MILNLPNIFALTRALIAPIMLWVMINADFFTSAGVHVSWVNYLAALLFTVASLTDFFDGFIARRLNQITTAGKILDPLADKMLMIAAFFGLMMTGLASAWAIYIILVRELFISGLRIAAISEGIDVSASWLGKVKTVVQMLAVGFLLMMWPGGELLLWLAVALTVISGYEYLSNYLKAINSKG